MMVIGSVWKMCCKRNTYSIPRWNGKKIQTIVSNFLTDETREEFESFGVPYKLNLLFHGYPGTGKTSLVYSIASELNMNVALLSFMEKNGG